MKTRALLVLFLLLGLYALPVTAQAPRAPVSLAGYEEQDTYRDWENNLFFQRMQEKTGIAFTYAQYHTYDDWLKAKPQLLAGDTLPQVLFKANLSPGETMALLDSGVLIDLAPLLPEYAPVLWQQLSENIDYMQQVRLPDGRIGALPYLNESPTHNAIWINRVWLDALKLALPATAEELELVLEAFKTRDPNGNLREDEVPFGFIGSYDLKYLAHAYGLAANDFNVFASGANARFMPLEDEFQAFIAWCRHLYLNGLLARDGFTAVDNLRREDDSAATKVYGAFLSPLPSSFLPTQWAQDYVVLPPLHYQGAALYRNVAPRATPGTFALTRACLDPGAMLAWVDYLYTEQGAILATNGLEGSDYLVDGDGTWRLTQSAGQSGFLAASTIVTGAVPPGISTQAFARRSGQALVRHVTDELAILDAVARDPFPPFSLSSAQEAEIAPLQDAIGRYVDESIARWVLGEWDTSQAQFDLFEEELLSLGLDAFMAFWQNVLDMQGGATP